MDTTDDAGGTDRGAHRRALIAGVIALIVLGAVVIAGVAATSADGPRRVRAGGAGTPPPLPSTAAAHPATSSTRAAPSTAAPNTTTLAPVTTAPAAPPSAMRPRSTAPTATPTTAALRTAPVSALEWTVPSTLTMKTGTTKTITVSAHNPTDGIVTLPHPLTCAPRLHHDEFCTEVVQHVAPGGTAGASYAVSAAGVAPGNYTLRIEGAVTIKVTVTK